MLPAKMRTLFLFSAIFVLCGAVSVDQGKAVPGSQETQSVDTVKVEIKDQPQGPVQMDVPLEGVNPAAESAVKSNDSAQKKAEGPPVKSQPKVETANSSEGVSDFIGETMFSRAAYLLTGISVLVLIYFAWKSFSLRRRQTHIHKYGVVASREDLEMTSLGFGSEDEDDDTTHFDIGKHQRS